MGGKRDNKEKDFNRETNVPEGLGKQEHFPSQKFMQSNCGMDIGNKTCSIWKAAWLEDRADFWA